MMEVTDPVHPRHQFHQHDSNKKTVVWIIILLLLSIEIPELTTYISYAFPSIKSHQSDWFLYSGFKMKIYEYYYFKFTSDRLSWMVRMIAFAKTANKYSITVFLATFLIMGYVVIDLFFFWFNYNEWPIFYEFLILFLYIVGRGLIIPYKPDFLAKVRSLF